MNKKRAIGALLIVIGTVSIWLWRNEPVGLESKNSQLVAARPVESPEAKRPLSPFPPFDEPRERVFPVVATGASSEERTNSTVLDSGAHGTSLSIDVRSKDRAVVAFPLTKDGIRAAMSGALPQIRSCYEDWLQLQPELAGQMKVQFTIESDDAGAGRVSKTSLGDSGIGHLAMEGCVLNVVSDLSFEEPEGVLNITYPFRFLQTDAGH
jgi:hypothetical protein